MEIETALPTVSFKEVHEELENESLFLKNIQEGGTGEYTEKGNFLGSIGFDNSIATKMYKAISTKAYRISEYEKEYHGLYRFILEPQLERVCEKYNLFVRPLGFFCGDIPAENIKHMQDFKLKFTHLPDGYQVYINNLIEYSLMSDHEHKMSFGLENISHSSEHGRGQYAEYLATQPDTSRERLRQILGHDWQQKIKAQSSEISLRVKSKVNQLKIDMKELVNLDKMMAAWGVQATNGVDKNNNRMVIAAIKDLFLEDAFATTTKRIDKGEFAEPVAKQQVDMDPIVMYETNDGYLIITAWGDEANDDLVANAKNN